MDSTHDRLLKLEEEHGTEAFELIADGLVLKSSIPGWSSGTLSLFGRVSTWPRISLGRWPPVDMWMRRLLQYWSGSASPVATLVLITGR